MEALEHLNLHSSPSLFGDTLEMLTDLDTYMEAGVHIGMRRKVAHMEPFIYFTKRNKLSIIDVEKIDERVQDAARLLAEYEPEDILVVSQKQPGHEPLHQFKEATDANVMTGRFMPGTLTNPNADSFIEPEIVVVTDPVSDEQAVTEAVDANIPIVALCDTANPFTHLDFVIPANNKGRNSLGLVYFLLADQYLDHRGDENNTSLDMFQPEDTEEEETEAEAVDDESLREDLEEHVNSSADAGEEEE